ncbi:hypothetical protein BOVA604_1999 [Bacteroides ovatus]|jgi:hypothetical protein|uniref:hypothetical protein n=1 Tax=Bacteroides ovatus TaxID=28116 RepID=UPI0020A82F98|nr:hypothetical protein [Bacteroides ovatus]CAG9894056.1 hypothetical protein BOVA604_1999 [Bacteroides ovatus]
MNNNAEFTVDAKQVITMFNEFNAKLKKKTFTTVLRKAANILRKQTITNLRQVVKRTRSKNRWNGKTLESGVRIKIAKSAQAAKVHLMGDFRLKFFEMGTSDRQVTKVKGKKLKKPRYTGKVDAKRFFQKAKQTTESQVFASIEQHLIEVIKKINNKYK